MRARPAIRRSGPITPPATIAPASQGTSARLERNLGSAGLREKERASDTAQDGDAEAGAAIEKPRENGRVDASKQHLGRRGRDAEERSRQQSEDDGVMVHAAKGTVRCAQQAINPRRRSTLI